MEKLILPVRTKKKYARDSTVMRVRTRTAELIEELEDRAK